MILKTLTVNNIRSYGEKTSIQFTKGSSLFEGDIGSGKSTILLAIEFALFGLGDIEGAHLLRGSKREGWVELTFEVDGKEYTVFRSLARRRKSVYQKEGYVVEDGVQTDYSVGEMKSRVLEILDFKEREQPRTSSLIYRYAVFTPQEMMKEVLLQRPDKRLETLRRAFGIEEYSSARENAGTVSRGIRTEIRVLQEAAKDLSDLKSSLGEERDLMGKAKKEFDRVERRAEELGWTLDALKEKIDKLQPRKEKVIRLVEAIPRLEEDIGNKKRQIGYLEERIKGLEGDLKEIRDASRLLKKLKPLYTDYAKKKKRIRTLEKSVTKYTNLERRKAKLDEAIKREEKHLKIRIKERGREIESLKKRIDRREEDLEGMAELDSNERRLTKEVQPLEVIAERISEIVEQISEKKRLRSETEALGKEINSLREGIAEREKELKDLPERQEQERTLTEEIKPLETVSMQIRGLLEQISETRGHIKTKRNDVKGTKGEWRDIEKIGVGAPCPRCRRKLTPKHYESVKLQYEKEIAAIEESVTDLEKTIDSLEKEEADLESYTAALEEKKETLERLGRTLARLTERASAVEVDKKELLEKRRKLNAMESTTELKGAIISLETEKTNLERDKKTLQEKKRSLEKLGRSLAKLRERASAVEADRKKLGEWQRTLDSDKSSFNNQAFAEKEREEQRRILAGLEGLTEPKEEHESLKQEISGLEEQRIEARYTESKGKASRKPSVTKDLNDSKRGLRDLQKEIKAKVKEHEEKTEAYERDIGVMTEIEEAEAEKTRTNERLTGAKEEAASVKQQIRSRGTRIKEIEWDIEQKERQTTRKEVLEQMRIWLDEYFTPCLQDIEIHVLASIQEEFDQLFQRWFNTMIETGDMSVRIDETFTSIIEQGGYELDVMSLSGGERTAVALAYRLALNTIVKKVCEAMHSNLLILDEPTDGFSKEQLSKLRDVLQELNCEQIIMVSHERELEGFVDKVYHVSKEGGMSRIH